MRLLAVAAALTTTWLTVVADQPLPPDRTLIVTRETSVFLPLQTATLASLHPSKSHDASPSPAQQFINGEGSEQSANIVDTFKSLGRAGDWAVWGVKHPLKATLWTLQTVARATWIIVKWTAGASGDIALFGWDYILLPVASPFMVPIYLFILWPLHLITATLITLKPLLLFLSSATILGLLLGLVGALGSGTMGDYMPRREQTTPSSLTTASQNTFSSSGPVYVSDGQRAYDRMTYTKQPMSSSSLGLVTALTASDDEDSIPSSSTEESPLRSTLPLHGAFGEGAESWRSQPKSSSSVVSINTGSVLSQDESRVSGTNGVLERKGSLIHSATSPTTSTKTLKPGLKKRVTFENDTS